MPTPTDDATMAALGFAPDGTGGYRRVAPTPRNPRNAGRKPKPGMVQVMIRLPAPVAKWLRDQKGQGSLGEIVERALVAHYGLKP